MRADDKIQWCLREPRSLRASSPQAWTKVHRLLDPAASKTVCGIAVPDDAWIMIRAFNAKPEYSPYEDFLSYRIEGACRRCLPDVAAELEAEEKS